MTGGTTFNSDLFGAEHLKIEDEAASTDIRIRREFGNNLKQISSPGSRRCHPKGREPINLLPFWRLSVSVNSEPENLLVLPPIDDSVKDKVIMLLCSRKPMPMPLTTGDERHAFEQTLLAELAAFVHWLRNVWQIPSDLTSARYGIIDWQHPVLMEAMGDLAPETHLLTLIDRVLFSGPMMDAWEGNASELQSKLCETFTVAREAQTLLKYPNACGTYLGRLAKQRINRVSGRLSSGQTRWTIQPPPKLAEAA